MLQVLFLVGIIKFSAVFSALFMYWKFREKSPFRFTYSGDFLRIHRLWFQDGSVNQNSLAEDEETIQIFSSKFLRLFRPPNGLRGQIWPCHKFSHGLLTIWTHFQRLKWPFWASFWTFGEKTHNYYTCSASPQVKILHFWKGISAAACNHLIDWKE